MPAEIPKRLGVQRDQLVGGILPEHVGQLGLADRRELVRVPRPGTLEPLLERARDREVAGEALALTDGRKPARAEVDRVEREDEGGPYLHVTARVVRLRVELDLQPLGRESGRIGRDSRLVDPDRPRPCGDPCAGGPDLVD